MGYEVECDGRVTISKDRIKGAVEALLELEKTGDKSGGSWNSSGKVASWFSWMSETWYGELDPEDTPEGQISAVAGVFQELGFDTVVDDEGTLNILWYSSKAGDEAQFLAAIAPFAEGEQFWRGEDGSEWAYEFRVGQPLCSGNVVKTVDWGE